MPHKRIPRTQPPGDHAEELLAIVAHELRRPLTALLGALATLQYRDQVLSIRQPQELLRDGPPARRAAQRLLGQLLAAAGVDRGQVRLVGRSLVGAAALAEEAGRAARLAHLDHPITIEVAGPLLVRVDPLAVSRILGNLLDNVAAYSPRGAPILLSAGREGVHALLAVRDQGPGIPLTDRDRIFQRYARLDQPLPAPVAG
jgi:two-component system sensor histidine kinase KdpD